MRHEPSDGDPIQDTGQDPPVREAAPERQSPVGAERGSAGSEERPADEGVERESPPPEGSGGGEESPGGAPEHARLTP